MRFILVDEILDLVPGKMIRAAKTLRRDEEIFRDHFPGFAVVPGVLLTEMMAQAAGQCLDAEDRARGKAMLVKIRDAAFRKWIEPDQRVEIHATITSSAPAYGSASCRVELGGEEVARADLLFAFVPYSQLADGYRDDVLERFLAAPGPNRSA